MKWLKRIFLTILVLLVLIIGISFFLPAKSHFERSTTINAKPEVVFGLVNNMKSYNSWMPWNKMDPAMQQTFSAQTVGKGASYSWVSKEMGNGKMTIVESTPTTHVGTELAFEGMGTSMSGWHVTPEAAGSKISWYMDSDSKDAGFFMGVMSKWMCSLGVMDKMLSKDFDAGLASLKTLAESPAALEFVPVAAAPSDTLVMPAK